MFAGFNVEELSVTFPDSCYTVGKELYEINESAIYTALEDYIVDGDSLSADEIMDDWFPQVDAQVFISHSHRDAKNVISFAGWLKQTAGITAFVDSCAWAYCDDLIKKLDKKYSASNDMVKINQVRAHVYMMLNSALLKMIDNTECLMFFNSSESLIQSKVITGKPTTYSPWIYSELLATNIIRRRSLDEHRVVLIHESTQFSELKMQYRVCLDGLEMFNTSDLLSWQDAIKKNRPAWGKSWDGEQALDILYASKHLFEKGYRIIRGKSING